MNQIYPSQNGESNFAAFNSKTSNKLKAESAMRKALCFPLYALRYKTQLATKRDEIFKAPASGYIYYPDSFDCLSK